MQTVIGTLLHKKIIKTKKGNNLSVISMLDEYDNYSQVIDITDFDNLVNGTDTGVIIELPIRSRSGVSERGNTFINYVVAGKPKVHQRIAD